MNALVWLTVSFPIDGALVESHDVLRQGAGLVTEDVFDLTQLLVERGGPRLCRSVTLGIIHLPVPVYEEAVAETDDLHTDNDAHTHRDKCEAKREQLNFLTLFSFCARTYLT